jgi:hypothetical protein
MNKQDKDQAGNLPPLRRDLKGEEFPVLAGVDDSAKLKYVGEIYQHAVREANSTIDWYLVSKKPKKTWAQATRLGAILFTAIGGLVPLIVATKVLPKFGETDVTQFGYIALALAAACVGLDKFFGFSSAWIRYLTTAMTLQKVLQEFQLDWAVICASENGQSPPALEARLKRIQTFLLRVHSELERETADWAAEYRSNLAEMEKSARQQLEANRPGSINLTVPNVAQATGGVVVLLDGASVQVITIPDCLVSPVFPGDHLVTIRGSVQGKLVSASQQIRVDAGRTYLLQFKLPEGTP